MIWDERCLKVKCPDSGPLVGVLTGKEKDGTDKDGKSQTKKNPLLPLYPNRHQPYYMFQSYTVVGSAVMFQSSNYQTANKGAFIHSFSLGWKCEIGADRNDKNVKYLIEFVSDVCL